MTASTSAAELVIPARPQATAPIRLLKAVTLFGVGGSERQFTDLALGLDQSRFDLQIACLKQWGFFLKDFEDRQIPVREFRIRSFYRPGTVTEQLRFGRHLRDERIEIVHCYNFYANLFGVPAARLARTPVVIATIRDLGIYLTPMQKRAQRLACTLADQVLVNAEAIKRHIVSAGYRADRISVIHNGVDLSRFGDITPHRRLHDEYGIPLDAPLIGVVGRLSPMKGLEDFLEAARLVAAEVPSARFIVIGAGNTSTNNSPGGDPYRDSLQRLAGERGLGDRVIFTGFRPDVPSLLPGLTISVLPSHSEGLSNALLESMAAGVPVVATDVGGTAEAVSHEETGLLIPPKQPQAIAAAVGRLLRSPALANRLGRAGHQRIEDEFSLKRLIANTEALYARLLNASRRHDHVRLAR
ncbi:MAG TPA: glycosyltransferase [Vicinamibacterales bacterium]|jgi:glycosyltransferase involved in cell wall biosynthesis